MKLLRITLMLATVLLLAACAANRAATTQREQAKLVAVHAAAGEPVNSFNFVTDTLYSWEPLSESELLVYTRPNQAWLLNVGACTELPYAIAIGLTSRLNQVSLLDRVVLYGNGANYPCSIRKIQPVNVKQLKRTMEQRPGGKIMPEPSK